MRRICGVLIALIALLVLCAPVVQAQTVVNPRFVEFTKSADHDVTLPDGSAMVASYEARWYVQGATAPIVKVTLGKPAPDATGLIRVSLVDPKDLLVGVPIDPKVTYVGRVAAISATGLEGESADSNPFVRAAGPKPPTNTKLTK